MWGVGWVGTTQWRETPPGGQEGHSTISVLLEEDKDSDQIKTIIAGRRCDVDAQSPKPSPGAHAERLLGCSTAGLGGWLVN